ncbi:matrixin family metalloprotease [Candidatus Binatia bacterium]|nr:matrixin family metalloprotease [Candidatus Binatia bacterium]
MASARANSRRTAYLFAATAVAVLSCVRPLWAGGNTQFRNPNNLTQAIDKIWDDRMQPIAWVLSQDGIPGSGIDNATLIGELTAAFDTWEALPASRLDFTFDGQVPLRDAGRGGPLAAGVDGVNLVTFTDPDVLFPPGVLAVAITFSFAQDTAIDTANADLDGDGTADIPTGTYPAGTIFDGDIVFNSSEPWSTAGAGGSIDVRAVALHEIGHFFGLCHSMIRDAVMWPFLSANIAAARTPKADDVAYASFYYPAQPAYGAAFGAIRGRLVNGFSNAAVLGGHVFAVDPLSGQSVVGAYSGDDGSYTIPALAAGNYLVAIEPLDGDPVGLDPARVNQVVQFTFDTNFPEEFYDANESNVEADPLAGLALTVSAGVDTAGIDIVTNTVQVPGVNRILDTGYNLFAYPVTAPADLTAFDLLEAIGDETAANAIDRFVPDTGRFERAEYAGAVRSGANFPIRRGEAYVVYTDAQRVVSFAGGTDCPTLDLARGLNLIGVPCPPAGYTAFGLLRDLGSQFEVDRIERFDPGTGIFQVAAYDAGGNPGGTDFPIVNGEGYAVTMLAARAGIRIPAPGSSFAPVIAGLSPGRGVPGTVVVILGEGFDPVGANNVVTFNGIGAGVVFATSTSLTVTVPGNAGSGVVRVTVAGRQSNGLNFVVVSPVATDDPNGPTELVSGQTGEGTLAADGEQDRYTFTALAGSLVAVRAEAVAGGVPDLVLVLEDPYGVTVATDDNGGGGSSPLINNFVVENTGTHTIVVSNVPGGGTGAYRVSLTIATRAAPTQLSIIGGDFQTGLAGSTLPQPLSIFLTGPTGAPVAGVPVTFVATGTEVGSTLDPANAGTTVLTTNNSGIVTVQTTLSATPGVYTITVTVPGAAPVTFTVAATDKAIASITMNGDRQQGTVGKTLPNPLDIILADVNGAPVSGALVAFKVVGGGGSINPTGAQTTGAPGKATTTFKLGKQVAAPQLVAAFVPGQSKPLLFEATPKADVPAKARSNKSNFNALTLGTARLNALQVQVFDQFDNPVPDVLVNYGAPAGLTVQPGLGPDGIGFTNFLTNADGLHVAMVIAETSLIPTIDEFGNKGTAGLAGTYTITAAPATGSAPAQVYKVDVDMGPEMVTASVQNDQAMIGQPLPSPVRKLVLRYQRTDRYTDANNDSKDDDNGDFRDENFTQKTPKAVPGVAITFEVQREDGNKETDFGLQPTSVAPTVATTDASGLTTAAATMGDVGGVNQVVGKTPAIPVTWLFADGTTLDQKTFTDANLFAESTNLVALPVVITTTVTDPGGGIDLATLNALLNGTSFFNGATPPAVPPSFPERLQVTAGGKVLTALPPSLVTDSAFTDIQVEYRPSRPKLLNGANTVQVQKVKDRATNEQAAVTSQGFTYP